MVGLVDGVEEIRSNDENMYDSAMRIVLRRAWRWLGVAGANGEAVVDLLDP